MIIDPVDSYKKGFKILTYRTEKGEITEKFLRLIGEKDSIQMFLLCSTIRNYIIINSYTDNLGEFNVEIEFESLNHTKIFLEYIRKNLK